jgi:hypothetical protein
VARTPNQANERSPCRKRISSNLERRRRTGRPSLRWLDSVKKALRILGVGGGITKALDRNL